MSTKAENIAAYNARMKRRTPTRKRRRPRQGIVFVPAGFCLGRDAFAQAFCGRWKKDGEP